MLPGSPFFLPEWKFCKYSVPEFILTLVTNLSINMPDESGKLDVPMGNT